MFEPQSAPRVFALPPGVDFPLALLDGLTARCADLPLEALAGVQLIVNTRRMARRIREILDAGPPRLLPRVSLLTDLGDLGDMTGLPEAIPPLRRRLELAQLIGRLLDREPDLAPRASIFALADSLAELMDEMQGEGVSPEAIRALDVSDLSGHWARTQKFIAIADDFIAAGGGTALDAQARQRLAVETLIAGWARRPPTRPIVLAGSTGSRGTTLMLMAAIARLPQGAVVLPGFDFDQPAAVWADLDRAPGTQEHPPEDHPQFRFRRLMQVLGIDSGDIRRWTDARAPSPARNRLISLALRPAPITDAWMREGPALTDLAGATADVTLLEAPSPRSEALAIALRLRQAAETGQRAALITPDRMLTRQVAAALDRWDILPDDSAGQPLQLSPPGRFLRHVAGLFAQRLTGEMLLTLLKHPLCHGGGERGAHLLCTRDLELHLRRKGPPFPDPASLAAFAEATDKPFRKGWAEWIGRTLCGQETPGAQPLASWTARLRSIAEAASAGSHPAGPGGLWERNAGQTALALLDALEAEAGHGGAMTARDFADLLGLLLAGEEVRDRDAPDPRIMIWGTLEARVQGAELLILGGLNEGSWPEAARPDPWLNRSMRDKAGLLLPERRIGLAAHDFQQAAAAPEVWLTRALRSDDSETVASRWLNRLVNLLGGLPDQGGAQALADMRARGESWLGWARGLEAVRRNNPAIRPSPRPPVAARPRELAVTEIKRLIRDPYAIYAKHVLRLTPLDPLVQSADARVRGTVLHDFLEEYVRASLADPAILDPAAFLAACARQLDRDVPWPTARRLWAARVQRIAGRFIAEEIERRRAATPVAFEARARAELVDPAFTLVARADRIDRDATGALRIYDYKTGAVPTVPQQKRFDKQLLLEAAMAERGAFAELGAAPVAEAAFLAIGSAGNVSAPLDEEPTAKTWAELAQLIAAYFQPDQGYTSRRMLEKDADRGDYDHLARFGEWDRSTQPTPEVLE